MDLKGFFSRREATEEARNRGIKLGKNYLAEMAHRGEGPLYHFAFGRAYYEKTTYIEWLIETLGTPFKSTAGRHRCSLQQRLPHTAQAAAARTSGAAIGRMGDRTTNRCRMS